MVGDTFGDAWNENSRDLRFEKNDALLFFAIFIKMLPIYNYMLERSQWCDPKAQRCCGIFGVLPSTFYSLKAIMKEEPVKLVVLAFAFSLIQLSVSL